MALLLLDETPQLETLANGPDAKRPGDRAATRAELGYALAQAVHSMDGFHDDEGAGWGRRQKAGAFYVSQDADVGAHDEKVPFIEGHVFYPKDDAGRRALGMPRIDNNVYAFENGLAIAALVNLSEAANDGALLAKARRAADALHSSHVDGEGHVFHAADSARTILFLADAASLGYALSELARVTNGDRYRVGALRIANAMQAQFIAPSGALFANAPDKGAVGVFAERRIPFDANVLAVRFYASLAGVTGDAACGERGISIWAALTTPKAIDEPGRNLGAYLLGADDLGLLEPVLMR